MKHIIITGAAGLVATELTFALLRRTDAKLYLLSTHPDEVQNRYGEFAGRVSCFTLQDFADFAPTQNIKFNYCIHTAFSRSSVGSKIVESIDYQRNLIALLKKLDLSVFVNISSQSVYGVSSEPLWTENTPLDPNYMYAMGKYLSEVVTRQMLDGSAIQWTNIRLCSVCENARFVRVFVQNAIEGKPIVLTAPNQKCSFMDVQDVANALLAFIEKAENMRLMPAYNLGANLVNTIAEIAVLVKQVAEEKYGIPQVNIEEQANDNQVSVGMDAGLFMESFSWKPQYGMKDMVVEMFEMLTNPNGGGYPTSFKVVYKLL